MFGGIAKPSYCLSIVLRYSAAGLVRKSEVILGLKIASLSCLAEQFHCLSVILRHAEPHSVHDAEF